MFRKKDAFLSTAIATAILATPNLTHAQDDEEADIDDSFILEELIVTARKRQELLQETPVAVTALNDNFIDSTGITDLRGLEGHVPGLRFNEQGSKNPSIFIRGIGQRESNALLDPGVGVYINGVYMSRTDSQVFDSIDVESVQILRGPQGTLFGKNNPGGAILVKTKPAVFDEYEGYVTTRLGSHGRSDAKLGINVPIFEGTAAARFNVASINTDGYFTNTVDGKKYGDEDRNSISMRLNWILTDTASMDVFAFYGRQEERGAPLSCVTAGNSTASFSTSTVPNADPTKQDFDQACLDSQNADWDKVTLNDPSVFEMTRKMLSTTISWSIADDLEFTSISSISEQDDILINDDQDGTAISGLAAGGVTLQQALEANGINGLDDQERQQITQEFQINWLTWDDKLNLTSGVFFSKEEINNGIFAQMTGNSGFLVIPAGPDNNLVVGRLNGQVFDFTVESAALFSQFSIDFTDWFQWTLGARYTTEKREQSSYLFSEDIEIIANHFDDPTSPGGLNGTLLALSDSEADQIINNTNPTLDQLGVRFKGVDRRSETFDQTTFSTTGAFKFPDHMLNDNTDLAMIYTTVSTGFKAGGFDLRDDTLQKFDEETVTNYEIGAKLDALDNHLRFNAALFRMDYKDLQLRVTEANVNNPANVLISTGNAGEVTIQGFEAELFWIVGNWDYRFVVNLLDTEYDEFLAIETNGITDSIVDRSAEPFGGIEEQYSLSVTYHINLDDGSRINPYLGWVYTGENYIGVDRAADDFAASTIDDYLLFNFRVNYEPGYTDQFDITAFIDNLTDEEYYQGGFSVVRNLGASVRAKGKPRTYGVEATFRF